MSPQVSYLNCTVYMEEQFIHKHCFIGDKIGKHLLDYLIVGSFTYFHNLKYDASFFINCAEWSTEITERSCTVLQIVMTKYKEREWVDPKTNSMKRGSFMFKRLVFRNFYSIIPAALTGFASMFNLNVHKKMMAYKLYTKRNIELKCVSALEFQLQYFHENIIKLTLKKVKSNWNQLIKNAKIAGAYYEQYQFINIMKYKIFYCQKDCIVLMKGIEKFDEDLAEVFQETNTKMMNVHNFISISSIDYYFVHKFGCFVKCHELSGNPQNFIQRCVSSGRTLTAGNKKKYIERLKISELRSIFALINY